MDPRQHSISGSVRVSALAALLSLFILSFINTIDLTGRRQTPPGQSRGSASLDSGPADRDLLASLGHYRASRVQAIIDNVPDFCIATDSAATDPHNQQTAELSRLRETIARSDLGAWLLAQTGSRQVLFCQDPASDYGAYYRAQVRLVAVNADFNEARKLVFLLHELAHVVQHPLYSNNRTFPPQDMLVMRRMREATAEAIATRVLWDLRQQGLEAPWQEKLKTHYRDIAQVFESAWHGTDPNLDRATVATRAAFDCWFAGTWRRNFYDDLSLDHLNDIATDRVGLIRPYRRLSDKFLRGIAWYGGVDFLAGPDHRSLLQGQYAGDFSQENAQRLQRFAELTQGPPAREHTDFD